MAGFHDILKDLMDEYAHLVYRISEKFPVCERYGITSQIRRAAVSVILNYIEGYARLRIKVNINFLEISYGSLKESAYLLDFSLKEGYVVKLEEYEKAKLLADKIGGMLWGTINRKKFAI